MTRRKRTPEPEPARKRVAFAAGTASSSFRIPASLQQLSALSATLARSTDAPRELGSSEIVAKAQALAGAHAPTKVGVGQNGRQQHNGVQQPDSVAGAKELKWRSMQQEFPEEQTWVKSVANYSTQGQARALVKKYAGVPTDQQNLAMRYDAINGGIISGGSGGTVQYPHAQTPTQPTSSPLTPSYRIEPDGKIILLDTPDNRNVSPVLPTPVNAQDDENGKKRKYTQFVDRHQYSFPVQQVWVQPQLDRLGVRVTPDTSDTSSRRKEGLRIASDDPEIEARRRALEHELVRGGLANGASPSQHIHNTPPPSAPRVTYSLPQKAALAAAQVGGHLPAQVGPPRMPTPESLEYDKHQAEIAALIARKRAENAASGQMARLLDLKSAHQQKVASAGGVASRVWSYPQQPVFRPPAVPTPVAARVASAATSARPVMGQQTGLADGTNDGRIDNSNESDEDAPGEDDEPDTSGVDGNDASNGIPNGGVDTVTNTTQHLSTDPGDLASLFSSRDPSPPVAQQQPSSYGYDGPSDGIRNKADASTTNGLPQSQRAAEEQDAAISPSAQLLIALANATPASSWNSSDTTTGAVPASTPPTTSTKGSAHTNFNVSGMRVGKLGPRLRTLYGAGPLR
ncbi:uncharacterized protein AB675_3308 [Cyphellophora attinorum]|uniref:Uncharacterized protein n=1 Tax=Cyphellophora attinorum TaxID=1664694 RepID=A0A0N1P077_9EURO|nr:uncharacterized protein AB675_3308 [Phialophora attinorum]KPI39540.1 hypothetical protein AB675_3308 [Phialophora attinorum]